MKFPIVLLCLHPITFGVQCLFLFISNCFLISLLWFLFWFISYLQMCCLISTVLWIFFSFFVTYFWLHSLVVWEETLCDTYLLKYWSLKLQSNIWSVLENVPCLFCCCWAVCIQILRWKLLVFSRLQNSKTVTPDRFCQCSCCLGGETDS